MTMPVTPADPPTAPPAVPVPRPWVAASVLVSVLVAVTSLAGILLEQTYARETAAWAVQAVGQDWANLAVAALLLASASLVRRGSLRAYLVWLGALLYLVYAFAIYAFAVHFGPLFPAYVAVLGLSFYTLAGGLLAADPAALGPRLAGNPRAGLAAGLLFVVGALFAALWLAEIVPAALAGTVPPALVETGLWTNPVHVLDLAFLLPGMIVAAVLLRRREYIGYLMAVPLLVFAVTMGLGIVVSFALSAARDLPYPLPAAVIVGAIMLLGTLVAWLYLENVRD